MNKIEYTYETCIDSIDGEHVFFYEIYEKNGKDERFVERSFEFFDTREECDHAGDEHCQSLEAGREVFI